MISRIEAYRYRCFSKLAVELGAYNVLAGANGSGKTTLLDIPTLLGDLVRERTCSTAFLELQASRAAPRAQTLTELIHQGRGDDFVLVIEARLPEEIIKTIVASWPTAKQNDVRIRPYALRYELCLRVFNAIELHVLNEYLFLYPESKQPELGGGLQGVPHYSVALERSRRRLRSSRWRSVIHRDPGEPTAITSETKNRTVSISVPAERLALASIPFLDSTSHPSASWFYDLLQMGVVFYEPDWKAVRQASPPGLPQYLLPSARNLAWLALDLQKHNVERFQDWIDHVRTALPQVEVIRVVEREEDHHAYLAVRYQGGYEVTSSGLSDGTLRILALTILPYLPKPPAILASEEPENGIHPRGIESILQSLTSLYDGQVWISTHSPVVLAQTELSRVLCAQLTSDGSVEVISGSEHPRLKDWKGELDLGTLFAAGVLG